MKIVQSNPILHAARDHTVRTWRRWQTQRTLTRLLRGIDRLKVAQIQARYARFASDPLGPTKYFDVEYYLRQNMERAHDLGLDSGPPRRVLDIGSGFGYFLYACDFFGHQPLGLDFADGNRDDAQCYVEMLALLGQRRVEHRITRFQPLPDLGGPFDLITAYAICFDQHKSAEIWGVAEWEYFLRDLRRFHAPDATLHFHFNEPTPGATAIAAPLREFMTAAGATVRGLVVHFDTPPHL